MLIASTRVTTTAHGEILEPAEIVFECSCLVEWLRTLGDGDSRMSQLNPSWSPWRYLVTRADGVFLVAT